MPDFGELRDENVAKMLADGPRIRMDYNKWIIARAPGRVLVGGVGAMGIGTMWTAERPYHADYPGWDDAPIAPDAVDDFGEGANGDA